ncbi:MAG: GGDEF domain-containing protein [Muribaculaceae bacterium]|nr:GGDEF domain-containing protein [Muribaculaceae bacterium]
MEKKEKTIGVLVGGVADDFTRALCAGIRRVMKEYPVHIVLLPGKFLDRDYSDFPDIMYEYQYETVFSFAKKSNMDGLIVAANCIGCYTTEERLREFMARYAGIPCVLASTKMEGYVAVNYDNYQGIKEGVSYMIEKLGYTRIGMVGGPPALSDSIERRAAFEQTLREHGIEPEERRYVSGDLSGNSRREFARLLNNNPDLQGVFCVNDEVASGLYEELKRRNLVAGRDISVFGYDNTAWSSQIFPTLSSVEADVSVLGEETLRLLMRMLDGETVESVNLPTRFVRRDSFCMDDQTEEERQAEVHEQYLKMNHLLDEQRGKHNRASFEMKQFILKVLRFERGNDQSYGEILGTMDWLGIRNAFIFLYDTPQIHLYRELFALPGRMYLKSMQCREKVSNVQGPEQDVEAEEIFAAAFGRLGQKNGALVTLPLYSNEMLYGVLLCDLTDEVLENGEFLGNQISAAVKVIDLLKTNEAIQKKLEESLSVLQENNLELETISKRDPLTGIYNRRSFYSAAEKLRKECAENGCSLMLLYVDMNNLKIINDRYGHEEGDFSLNTIARILTRAAGSGVVARIGGDEFACALTTELKDSELFTQLADDFDDFNAMSDRPYNVTVSVGAYLLRPEDTVTLENALRLADGQLYEMKKKRKKDVVKHPS